MEIVKRNRRILIVVGLLLVSPGAILLLIDPTYVAWMGSLIVPMSVIGQPFSVDTHPSNPVIPNELVSVFVTNSTDDPVENASVSIAYINGTVISQGETSYQGVFQFDFPGDVVSITVIIDGFHSTIIRGLIPSYYSIILGLSAIGGLVLLFSLYANRYEFHVGKDASEWEIQTADLAQAVREKLETPLLELKSKINTSTKSEQSEFIKDMMALTNRCFLECEKGFIVVGPMHDGSTPEFLDDADYQNIVNNRLQSDINFLFRLFEDDGITYGVFIIQPTGSIPILAKKLVGEENRKLLDDGECWLRQGTKKTRLNSEQIVRLAHDIAVPMKDSDNA